MIKIIIVEYQEITREILKKDIEQDGSIKVIGYANDGQEVLVLCHQMLPDLVLMDLLKPDYDDIKTIRLIREKHQDVRILLLSSAWDENRITKALKNGADGCLFKAISREKLIAGIKSAVSGLKVIDKEIYQLIPGTFRYYNETQSIWIHQNINQNELSDKQLVILGLLAEGLKEEAIALEVGLSINTIKYHKKQIFDKLEVECTSEALVKAVRMNLIPDKANMTVYVC